MKIIFVFVALLVGANVDFCRAASLFGNQKPSETEGEKIDVRASDESDVNDFQIPRETDGEKSQKIIDTRTNHPGCGHDGHYENPSANIQAQNKYVVTYRANQVIRDWSDIARFSVLAGGMKYHGGVLQVPVSGRYYIYTQLYFYNNGRAYLAVNNKHVTMIQAPSNNEASLYAGGVFNLEAGDRISVIAANTLKLYMSSIHSYFGAYLV